MKFASNHDKILSLARNEVEYLPHGWCVIRNRTTKEVQSNVTRTQRDVNEKAVFSNSPWNELEDQFIGIESLRNFLEELVHKHTRENLFCLVQEIHILAEEAEDALDEVLDKEEHLELSDTTKTNSQEGKDRQIEDLKDETLGSSVPKLESSISNSNDMEMGKIQKRPVMLLSATMVAFTIALVLTLMGLGARQLSAEIAIDGNYARLGLLVVVPLQMYITLVSNPLFNNEIDTTCLCLNSSLRKP